MLTRWSRGLPGRLARPADRCGAAADAASARWRIRWTALLPSGALRRQVSGRGPLAPGGAAWWSLLRLSLLLVLLTSRLGTRRRALLVALLSRSSARLRHWTARRR